MPNTPYWGWVYPAENEDPHFDKLEAFFQKIDEGVFALLNTSGNIIIPPATVNWNNITNTLTWVGSFEIPILSSGFSCYVINGPDGLTPSVSFNDGERLIATVQSTLSGAVNLNFQKVSGKVNLAPGVMVVGFCRNNKFYANFPQTYAAVGGGGSGVTEYHGSGSVPILVDPTVGLIPTSANDQLWFLTPSTGGPGQVLFSSTPQIGAGTTIGQRLTLCGVTNGITGGFFRVVDGNGVGYQNGPFNLISGQSIVYMWDGSSWRFLSNAI